MEVKGPGGIESMVRGDGVRVEDGRPAYGRRRVAFGASINPKPEALKLKVRESSGQTRDCIRNS